MFDRGWVIATDVNYVDGMVHLARQCTSGLDAFVVGSRVLAEEVSVLGVDKVYFAELADDVPPEAAAALVSRQAEADNPGFIISNESPAARVLLGSAAGMTGATVLSDVIAVSSDEPGVFAVRRLTASGIAVESLRVDGALAVVYGGADADADETARSGAPIVELEIADVTMKVVDELSPAVGAVDLSEATRIIGLGRGVRSKDDLEEIGQLADTLGATLACTLPLCDDSRWFPAERVLGSSHNQASPELYIALGISGSPNHVSGVKNSKVIVAVNNDPDAAIFQRCDYGIVGDLYDFVPAFKEALAGE